MVLWIPAVCFLAACGKNDSSARRSLEDSKDSGVGLADSVDNESASLSQLGFASRIPREADLYFATYGVSDGVLSLMERFEKHFLEEVANQLEAESTESGPREPAGAEVPGDGPEADGDIEGLAETSRHDWEKTRQVLGRIGNEQFVYVGGGFGDQMLKVVELGQELVATMYGLMLKTMLEGAGEGGLENHRCR